MKRLAILLAVLAAVALVGCRDTKDDSREQVRKVLREYSQAVHEEVVPHMHDLGEQEIVSIAKRIARDKLVPHKALLIADAQRRLAEFPHLVDLGDRSDWENVIEPIEFTDGDLVRRWLSQMTGASDEGGGDLSEEDVLVFGFYDPFRVAGMAQGWYLSSAQPLGDLAKRSYLAALAPPAGGVADRNPENPVIVSLRGPEITVVKLRREQAGYYRPVRIEWLRRKGAAPATQEAE
ncbi:hypothetical protein LCGC14_0124450 [marine sediment metagenome]|uniref:Lipoprotein n=1 Tax=marine sediment metagenome TaxID=412755 RepID=A0A0F9V5Y9_9ZZZZ|nr:hypothetical protein [Phycisphaerae bacterium]HDZ42345.1 hypothetical protein [Phycisphaerae bacterium]